jgi:hypothetical protein
MIREGGGFGLPGNSETNRALIHTGPSIVEKPVPFWSMVPPVSSGGGTPAILVGVAPAGIGLAAKGPAGHVKRPVPPSDAPSVPASFPDVDPLEVDPLEADDAEELVADDPVDPVALEPVADEPVADEPVADEPVAVLDEPPPPADDDVPALSELDDEEAPTPLTGPVEDA